MTDNTEANYEDRTTIKSVATTKETDNEEEIYSRTTMANVSPNSVIDVESTPGLKPETASKANFSPVETTSLANIEATSNNEAKSVSNIETSPEAGVEAKTVSSIEESSKANIEAKPVAGIQASSGSGIEASSKGSIEASSEANIEAKTVASSEASSKGSIEATSIKSEVKDTKTSLKGNSLSSNTATPLSNIEASLSATDKIRSTSLTSKFESNSISTVKSSSSNFETTVPSATNSRLNSNKLNTETTSESEAKIKSSEFEATTKFPFEAEATTRFPFEAEARRKFPSEAEAEMKSSKSKVSTKSLFTSSTSEAESPSKTGSLVNFSTEATFVANNTKPEALTIISTSFTPHISSLNTRRNFETNFASNNTFSYTEASQINNSETISATTLFPPTEATEPLINVSEANAYINNESTSKTKTEADSSIILVDSASSFNEATSIPKTEAGSTITNLASSASSFNEATSIKPTLSTTEENSIKNITDTSNRTSFKLLNVSEASTMLPFETEIKLRFKSGARTKFFSKSEATTKFTSESEARKKVTPKFETRMKSSKSSTVSVSTIESVAPTKFPSESEAKMKSPFEPEAKKKVPFTSETKKKFFKSSTESASTTESVAPTHFPSEPETKMKPASRFEASTKSPSEVEALTKSPSKAEAKVKTTESEAKMNSPSESETSTSEPQASTSFKFEAITKFPFEAEASAKSSTKPLASTNIFKNIEVNSSKATRRPGTRSKEISFENFLNKIGERKFSTKKPKLSSENYKINLLNTTPFEAITEGNINIFKPTNKYETNSINNEAASTNIIKTEAETTNQNIETNTGPTLEAKSLVSNFEAKSEANTKSTYPIKSEATSEIYSKNAETITEAPLSLANAKNLGANFAATASEADSVTNREFEQTTPLVGIEATTVANIVATSKPVASNGAVSVARIEAISTPLASIEANTVANIVATSIPVAIIEATSMASNEATSTVANNGAASVARIEAISTPEASIKATLVGSNEVASLAKVNSTSASNIEANTESTSLINSRTNVLSTSAVNEVSLKPTPATLIFDKNTQKNIEANSVAFSTPNFLANSNGTTSAAESSEANSTSSGFVSKATESSTASNVSASRFKISSEATTKTHPKTTLKTPRRFTKLQNCLQNWTRTTQNTGTASITIKPIVEASSPNVSLNKITVSVEDSTNLLSSKISVFSPQTNTISPTKQNIETASITVKPEASTKALNKNIVASPNKTTVSVQDSIIPFPSKNIRVVSPQTNTISPLKVSSSLVSTNFGFNCSKSLQHYCGQQAFCSDKSVCQCLPGFSGFPPLFPCNAEISLNASSNSLRNLECFNNSDSKCGNRCENGYFLNSNGSCEDVDECKMGVAVCGEEAFCRNLEGAYRCECPKILKDGHECAALSPKSIKEYIKVKCFRGENLENSAIQVYFTSNVWIQFKGRVIVNGSQAENPKCFKDFSSNNNNTNNSSNFLIPANECKLIEKGIKINTLSTRLLIKPIIELKSFNYLYIPPIYFIQIQCHFVEEENLTNFSENFTKTPKITTKMGITKTPKMTSQKVFEDVFDKKMMRKTTKTTLKTKTTRESVGTATKSNLVEEPICLLDVTDKNGVHVLKIKAGETLTLTLSLVSRLWQQKIRNITIFPKRCYAINLDNGGRYCLTDNGGCAFEKGLFPEWKRKNNYKSEANFSAFRWTETNSVRFECDCSVCSEEKCPKFDCEKRRNLRFKKYFYNNWSLNENDESSVDNENLASLTWLSRPSSLPVIMEVDDENKRRRRRKRRKV
ncbi:unnamed protein product [Meloidogyne enterolobii]|uniref:Uncharacterized protein n=1 Tax=Meloidogyne enterolobii TaxID=390850 RepID=A0ACB1APJ7_MELEN